MKLNLNPIIPVLSVAAKICSALLYLITIVSAFGGKISPHLWATPSVFTLMLPYFAVATLVLAIGWGVARKWIMMCAGVLTLLVCSGPILTVSPMGLERKPSPADTPRFSLMTYNILHGDDVEINDTTDNRSFEYIVRSGVDIVLLQELVDFSKREIKYMPKALRDSLFKAYPFRVTDGPNDLTMLSKYPGRIYKIGPLPAGSGHYYEGYRLNIMGRKLTIINVHLASYHLSEKERGVVSGLKSVNGAKSSLANLKGTIFKKLKGSFVERSEHAMALRSILNEIKGPVILCGDFNDVPASWAYNTIMGEDMHDAYVETNFGPIFTYNRHRFYFHIDQIMYRGDLKALSVKRGDLKSSDHYPLIAEFAFTNP